MKIIHRPKGAGKTFELIKLASQEKHRLIVCHSKIEANRVWHQMIEMQERGEIEYLPPRPISYQELLDRQYYGHIIDEILIDNADIFLQYLCQVKIGAISISGEPEIYQDELSKIPDLEHRKIIMGKWNKDE